MDSTAMPARDSPDLRSLLIVTKLRPPTPDGRLVWRPRLLARLDQAAQRRVTLVRAPAGFGKSSLLAQWFETARDRDDDVGWVSLDEEDNDITRLVRHIVAAIRARRPGFGEAVLAFAAGGHGVPTGSLPAILVNEIALFEKDFFLILDDVHFLTNRQTLDALATLIQRAGSRLHLILASRETPELPLGRLRAIGQLVEIEGRDLQFQNDETAAYFSQSAGLDVSPDDILALNERTEGWIAGLQLAAISLRNRSDAREFIRSFSGGHRNISDFLAEDVLNHQREETRDFLLRTSVLGRLCPDLCDAVTGRRDSRKMLTELERANLFIFSLDDNRVWYRYHHLFSEFLSHRLSDSRRDEVPQLHMRASDWFWRERFVVEAIQHALMAGDMDLAAGRLAKASEQLFAVGRLSTIMELARRIPKEILAKYPDLRLNQIWAHQLQWQFDDARRLLAEVRETVPAVTSPDNPQISDSERRYLRGKLMHRELMMAVLTDEMPHAEKLIKAWLQEGLTDDPWMQASAQSSLVYARREQYDTKGVADAPAIYDLFIKGGAIYGTVWHDSIFGPTYFLRGDLERAERLYLHGMDTAIRINGRQAPLTAMPALMLAEVYYEQNRLDEARKLLDEYLPLAADVGFVDKLIAGYLSQARLLALDGDWAGAQRVLDEGDALASARGFARLHTHIVGERIREALAQGETDQALRLADEEDLLGPADRFMPRPGVTTRDEVAALAWARIAMIRGQAETAVQLMRRWVRFAEDRCCYRTAIRAGVQGALALQMAGDPLAAQRLLRSALAHAVPGRFIRSFADEGPPMAALLEAMGGDELGTDRPLHEHRKAILAAIAAKGRGLSTLQITQLAATPVCPLQPRELEILRLVGSGLVNREIADQLGLTPGTVKWYLQQIFSKLGVHRRSQAAGRARQLGLIP